MATMMLSLGVPMIGHGDELGRTQLGNNNAYCQDSELTWVDWQDVDEVMVEFTRRLVRFRTRHPAFRRRRFFTGRPVRRGQDSPIPDVAWFAPDGRTMTEEDWSQNLNQAVTLFMNGEGIRERAPHGERHIDSSFVLCFNANSQWTEFVMPPGEYGGKWRVVIDTSQPGLEEPPTLGAGAGVWIPDRCLLALERVA
jgi:glycogen operon protein